MRSIATSVVVFACLMGSAALGLTVRRFVPRDRLKESVDSVRLIIGLVITMSSLILGFLVTSAKGNYDTQRREVADLSSKVVLLDHLLAHYGPEAEETRALLRNGVANVIEHMWARQGASARPPEGPHGGPEALLDSIQSLVAASERQRALQSAALSTAIDVARTRWLTYAQASDPVSMVLPAMLVMWFAAVFLTFGFYAPPHPSVVICFAIAAFTISSAMLLIVELYTPYEGLIRVSDKPLREALMQLGK